MQGKHWLLLPDGFRTLNGGETYPIPTKVVDLEVLAAIKVPAIGGGKAIDEANYALVYLQRVKESLGKRAWKRQSAVLDNARRQHAITVAQARTRKALEDMKAEARAGVESVKAEAARAVTSLTTLFDLGRKGLDEQMRAHLENREWQGEKIDAKAFRECFRMVAQAVKGLGLPNAERANAEKSVMDEVAAAISETKSALEMDTSEEGEVSH